MTKGQAKQNVGENNKINYKFNLPEALFIIN